MDIDNTMSTLNDNLSGESEVTSNLIGNPDDIYVGASDIVVGLFFSLSVLACGIYLSQMYSFGEREEIAQAERNRVEAENTKIKEMESYRVKISKVIEGYAIRLTGITSSSLLLSPSSRHKSDSNLDDEKTNNRTIPTGNGEGVEMASTTSFTSKSIGSEDPGDTEGECENNISDTEIQTSVESLQAEILAYEDQQDRQMPSSSLSLSSSVKTMTRSELRDAVAYNPCVICLEPFRPGDVIVCCSNNTNGQRPHIFHQACSLDYIVSHNDGMKAPCPCCKRLLLPSEKERTHSFKHSLPSVLTLTNFETSDDSSDDEEELDFSNTTE